jgi:hypothetical protein
MVANTSFRQTRQLLLLPQLHDSHLPSSGKLIFRPHCCLLFENSGPGASWELACPFALEVGSLAPKLSRPVQKFTILIRWSKTVMGDKIVVRTILLDQGKSLKAGAEIFGKDRLSWVKEVAQTFEVLPPS